MPLLGPRTRALLGRSRLVMPAATAHRPFGDRSGRGAGEGLEFVDHRSYEPGDDARYLDPHVFARTGQHVVKRYAPPRGLDVTLAIDATASMRVGTPAKIEMARVLGALIGHAAIAGHDRVQLVRLGDGRSSRGPAAASASEADALERWLPSVRPSGDAPLSAFANALGRVHADLRVCVFVSDLLFDDADAALAHLAADADRLLVLHVLAPEDLAPPVRHGDAFVLQDAETGGSMEVRIDDGVLRQYGVALDRWRTSMARTVHRYDGRYLWFRTDEDVDREVLPRLRRENVLR